MAKLYTLSASALFLGNISGIMLNATGFCAPFPTANNPREINNAVKFSECAVMNDAAVHVAAPNASKFFRSTVSANTPTNGNSNEYVTVNSVVSTAPCPSSSFKSALIAGSKLGNRNPVADA